MAAVVSYAAAAAAAGRDFSIFLSAPLALPALPALFAPRNPSMQAEKQRERLAHFGIKVHRGRGRKKGMGRGGGITAAPSERSLHRVQGKLCPRFKIFKLLLLVCDDDDELGRFPFFFSFPLPPSPPPLFDAKPRDWWRMPPKSSVTPLPNFSSPPTPVLPRGNTPLSFLLFSFFPTATTDCLPPPPPPPPPFCPLS